MFDFGLGIALAVMEQAAREAERERKLVERMRADLSPEAFMRWEDNRTAERRHRELCRSIERAGDNARAYNFWGRR